jgi:proteasome lid subunit RPN8/RPN11
MLMSVLKIKSSDWSKMRIHAESDDPREACGLIAAREGLVERVIPIENISSSNHRYKMDPAQQVRAFFEMETRGLDLAAIYHSHPEGSAEPSPIDLEEWRYGEACSLIWSKLDGDWVCCAYKLSDSDFIPVEIEIISTNTIASC